MKIIPSFRFVISASFVISFIIYLIYDGVNHGVFYEKSVDNMPSKNNSFANTSKERIADKDNSIKTVRNIKQTWTALLSKDSVTISEIDELLKYTIQKLNCSNELVEFLCFLSGNYKDLFKEKFGCNIVTFLRTDYIPLLFRGNYVEESRENLLQLMSKSKDLGYDEDIRKKDYLRKIIMISLIESQISDVTKDEYILKLSGADERLAFDVVSEYLLQMKLSPDNYDNALSQYVNYYKTNPIGELDFAMERVTGHLHSDDDYTAFLQAYDKNVSPLLPDKRFKQIIGNIIEDWSFESIEQATTYVMSNEIHYEFLPKLAPAAFARGDKYFSDWISKSPNNEIQTGIIREVVIYAVHNRRERLPELELLARDHNLGDFYDDKINESINSNDRY